MFNGCLVAPADLDARVGYHSHGGHSTDDGQASQTPFPRRDAMGSLLGPGAPNTLRLPDLLLLRAAFCQGCAWRYRFT